MSKKKKPRNKKRRKSSVARDRRGRRLGASNAHVRQFVEDERLGETEARIAQAAMPGPWRYHTSHWLDAGVQRAVKHVGCTELEAIPVVERMQRWAHRIGRISQQDAALQIAGLELLRRQYGGEARVIAPPEPVAAMDLPVDDVRMGIAHWEAMSYASVTIDPRESELESDALVGAATLLMFHLARTDGVPVRLDRIQASDYAAELTEMNEQGDGACEHFVPQMLAFSADVYERLANHPRMDRAMCKEKAAELGTLAMAMAGPSYAA